MGCFNVMVLKVKEEEILIGKTERVNVVLNSYHKKSRYLVPPHG